MNECKQLLNLVRGEKKIPLHVSFQELPSEPCGSS